VSRVEELIPDLAKDREVVEVGHERGELDEIAWAGASRTEGSDRTVVRLAIIRYSVGA